MDLRSTRDRLIVATIGLALLTGACGGGSTGGSAGTSAAPSVAASAAGSGAADPNVLPKPELSTVRIGIGAPNEPVQFAATLAKYLGIYEKYGLSVEITGFEGEGKALQALVAGKLDMFVGGASTTINSILTDTPVNIVAMNSTVLTDGLFCTKDIKTAADVKGKSLAIGSFGATAHGSALLMLKGIGLTAKDVTITQIGNEGTRIAALKGGSVGCAVIDMGQESTLKQFNFNIVFDLSKAKLQWGRSGLEARTDFIAKNPNTVLVVVAATLLAQNSIWTDTPTATAKFAEFAQLKPEAAATAINSFLTYGSRSMRFSADAFSAPREVLSVVNPAVANVDVTKAFDLRFLDKLRDSGFYAKNKIPLD